MRNVPLSKNAMSICSASLHQSTNSQYSKHLDNFRLFCNNNDQHDYMTSSVENIVEYLTSLFNSGKSYSTINSARSALSYFVVLRDNTNTDIGKHPLVTRFMRGVFKLRPPRPKYNSTWDVNIVLSHLRGVDNKSCSIKQLTLKCAMLLALCTGQRVQTLEALRISNLTAGENKRSFIVDKILKTSRPGHSNLVINVCRYAEESIICPVACLDEYVNRTKVLRETQDELFISFAKPYKSVSVQTIARWLTLTLSACGINKFYTAHSTRAASTSKAASATDINTVLHMAGWASARTFAKFYNKPVLEEAETFVNAVLKP